MKQNPGFAWFIESRRYLHASEVLRNSDEYRLIKTPQLHLLAHGSELLLKANLIANGCPVGEARAFGHEIWALWNDARNTALRADVLKAANEEWIAAKMDPAWKDSFKEDSAVLFEEYLARLNELHTRQTDFALRYVRPEETEAPRPHLLGPTMYRIADQSVRNFATF